MMELQKVTSLLSRQGIHLTASNGKLNARKYTGTIPQGLRKLIREREKDLLEWLEHKKKAVRPFPLPKEKIFPAFATQKALWLSQKNAKPHYIHHAQVKIHISGQVNLPLLIRCLDKLIARRESLRTVLRSTDEGELLQLVKEPFPIDIPLFTICDTLNVSPSENLERIALEQAQTQYDLSRGPMFRTSVLQLADNTALAGQQIIIFSFHRIILDDRTWGFLLREWMMLYESYTSNSLPKLQVSEIDYADFSVWSRQTKIQ